MLHSSECAYISARTFGHHFLKRISFAMLPAAFVVGVITTLLAALTVVSIKGLGVGVSLLRLMWQVTILITIIYIGHSPCNCSGANAGTYFAGSCAVHHTCTVPSTVADTLSGQLATIDIIHADQVYKPKHYYLNIYCFIFNTNQHIS